MQPVTLCTLNYPGVIIYMFLPALLTYLTHKYSAVRGKTENCTEPRHILIRGLQQTLPTELTSSTQPGVLGAEQTHVLIRGL